MTDIDRTAQLERACSYLRRIPAWYLATTDASDGHQPRVRPFSFAMVDDGKLWFCTSRDKDVWAELSANPKFEVSGWKPGECWIVLTGEAALEDDAFVSDKVRQAGFKHMVGIGEQHDSANDGRLAFFSVRNIAARFCDIDGSEERLELYFPKLATHSKKTGQASGGHMDGLNTVLEYLTSVPAWYLATSVGGQPHVRPFSFAQIQDGKLWFVTARTKDVWQELLQNQRFEATSWWPGHGWLILRGRAGLEDRASSEMREAGWKHLERLSEHYEGPNDPALVFFSVEDPEAFICNHDEWVPVEL